jgi:flagellar export protein FliJ
MKFRFALDTLLRVRENLEKISWRVLQSDTQKVAAAREQLQRFDRWHELQNQSRSERIRTEGLRASELHFWRDCDVTYSQRRDALLKQMRELERACNEARERFVRIRRDREVVSELRNRAHETYRREVAKKEQIAADENFILGRGYRE